MIDYLMLYLQGCVKESIWKSALVYGLFLNTVAQGLKICKHEFTEKYNTKPCSW